MARYQIVRSIIHDLAIHEYLDGDSCVSNLSLKTAVATASTLVAEFITSGADVTYGEISDRVVMRFSLHHDGVTPRTVYWEVQKMRRETDVNRVITLLNTKTRPTFSKATDAAQYGMKG